jgi:hypothetical protein
MATTYMTFGLETTLFALPVTLVQEILDTRPVSRLPNAPPACLGLIDVRGRSVAKLDMPHPLPGIPAGAALRDSRCRRWNAKATRGIAHPAGRSIEGATLGDDLSGTCAGAGRLERIRHPTEFFERRTSGFARMLRLVVSPGQGDGIVGVAATGIGSSGDQDGAERFLVPRRVLRTGF